MLKAIFFCVVLGLSQAKPFFDSDLDTYWHMFKQRHGKAYTLDEEPTRRFVWEKNIKYIHNHNLEADMGMHTFSLGMNEYGDLTDAEFNSMLKGYTMQNKTNAAPVFMAPNHFMAPEEVDWRKEGYVTEIKNQGHCGSCWAFSATGSLEGQHFKKTKTLVSLSEQNLVDCSAREGNKGCKGGNMDNAFKYIRMNGGIDTEESYPYEARTGTCRYKSADVGATDSGSVDIKHGSEMDLQQAVATVGPISVAIDASKSSFRFYKNGVYTDHQCSSTRLDHGVLAVGYGTMSGKAYWIVKNSWGKTWGDEGYIMMARNARNMCGIATQASYPTV